VPAAGMGEIPRQLAAGLAPGTVRLGAEVTGFTSEAGGQVVELAGGGAMHAGNVVVAVDGPAALRLLGERLGGSAPGRGTTTLHYRAATSPVEAPVLVLDGDGRGPVNNLTVMTDVAPSYAPPG